VTGRRSNQLNYDPVKEHVTNLRAKISIKTYPKQDSQ